MMNTRNSGWEEQGQDGNIWLNYKKPTKIGDFFKVFQLQSWNAGVPILDKKEVDKKVAIFIKDFTRIERFDLDYLNSILPIRYCNILPRNYAALLLGLYINAVAEKNNESFIDTFKNMSSLNSLFEQHEKRQVQWDDFLSSKELRESIYDIEDKKSKKDAYYIIKTRLESPLLIEPLVILLLFDLNMFKNKNERIYAILNFTRMHELDFDEGIAFFEDSVQDNQNIEIFYKSGSSISFTKFYWEPDVLIARKNAYQVLKKYRERYMSKIPVDYRTGRRIIQEEKGKLLNKEKYKSFENIYKSRGMKFSVKDLTKNFKIYIPNELVEIKNYHALLGLLPAPRLYPWTAPPPLDVTVYRIIKRRLFLYKMVGPFREILGLPKRRSFSGRAEFYTKEIPEGIPMRTKEIIKEYVSPSQILYKIVKYAQNNAGDVERTLQYIRGIYRASKKVAQYLDIYQPEIVSKIVSKYLEV